MATNPAIVVAVVLIAVAQLAGAGLTPQYYSPPSSPPPRSQSSPPPPPRSSPSPPPPPPPQSSPPLPPPSSPPPSYQSSPPPPPSSPPPSYQSSPPPPPPSSPLPSYQSSPPPPYQSSPQPPPRSSPPPPYQSSSPPPQSSPPPPSGPSGPGTGFQASGWQDGSATFYGDNSGQGRDFGGACGYSGSDIASLYSTRTAALSTPLFSDGHGCGRCYEIRCVKSKWCNPGSPSITITGTNLCPPNWNKANDNGGWCNPPRQHFDMTQPSFKRLAARVAGIISVQFRRVPCQRSGGIRFCIKGNAHWLVLYVMNVGACGDISEMAVRMADGDWVQMSQNWGIAYQDFTTMDKSKALAVRITGGSSPETIIVSDAIPAYWSTGLCYQGSNNFW